MLPLNSPYASLEHAEAAPVLQVAEVIRFCNELFAQFHFRVEGEVAGFSLNRGKFVFFDLKDEQQEARISCFMMAYQLHSPLEDGMRVVVEARPGLYQKNGQFRLTVSRAEPVGEGSLKRAFELLKQKLDKEGLFAASRKRTIPRFVQQVGIISSSGAAGYGDFKKIALARLPGVQYYLANVAVQGKDAEAEICQALESLNTVYSLDAIVLLRGGGSIEDLHAFNSEAVARAIVRSRAPVMVGVGHERDVTIADFAADVRAATPSNAAQLLLPSPQELEDHVRRLLVGGQQHIGRAVTQRREQMGRRLERLDDLFKRQLEQLRSLVTLHLKTIDSISPEQTLRRGYSITTSAKGKSILDASELRPGEQLTTRFYKGSIQSIVQA